MTIQEDNVIVVNENDVQLGIMNKLKAHEQGILHRAFSIFILNNKEELLLQQRANDKYHSGGLWSNTCCSHPKPNEDNLTAANRRLNEEMGFNCPLEPMFALRYRSAVSNNLIENEFDYIFYGYYDGPIKPNPEEANDYKFLPLDVLKNMLAEQPDQFTAWLHIAFPKFYDTYAAIRSHTQSFRPQY